MSLARCRVASAAREEIAHFLPGASEIEPTTAGDDTFFEQPVSDAIGLAFRGQGTGNDDPAAHGGFGMHAGESTGILSDMVGDLVGRAAHGAVIEHESAQLLMEEIGRLAAQCVEFQDAGLGLATDGFDLQSIVTHRRETGRRRDMAVRPFALRVSWTAGRAAVTETAGLRPVRSMIRRMHARRRNRHRNGTWSTTRHGVRLQQVKPRLHGETRNMEPSPSRGLGDALSVDRRGSAMRAGPRGFVQGLRASDIHRVTR